jgi:hypothetical protein
MNPGPYSSSSPLSPADRLGPYQVAAAAAVASLGVAAETLNDSANSAADWRRFLAESLLFSHEGLALLHREDLSRLASLVVERKQLLDSCAAELALLSEAVDLRRIAAQDSKSRTTALSSIGDLEEATRHRLLKEGQAARQRLFRIRRLLEAKVLT